MLLYTNTLINIIKIKRLPLHNIPMFPIYSKIPKTMDLNLINIQLILDGIYNVIILHKYIQS